MQLLVRGWYPVKRCILRDMPLMPSSEAEHHYQNSSFKSSHCIKSDKVKGSGCVAARSACAAHRPLTR